MKNVLIIFALIISFAAAGFVGTVETVRRYQKAQAEKVEAAVPKGSGTRALAQRGDDLARATADLEKRQTYALVGGGIGGGLGLLVGVGIAMRRDRRPKV